MNFMRIHTTTAFNILLAASIFFVSCSEENHNEQVAKDTAVPVTVAVAGKQSSERIHASGHIESKETAVISTRVMGFITGIKVKVGDAVKQGQLLATISNDDILAKKAQAQAMVAEAEAALGDAQKDQERFAELYKQQSASSKEFENATLHYNSLKSKTEAARQMQNEVEAMLSYTNLKAPFSGIVTQKNMDAGSMVNPGMPILVVEQTGTYQVKASVSESDIAQIKAGAEAEILIKSTGKIIRGEVAEVSPSSKFSGGQYAIVISIPKTETNGLFAGMSVNVAIASNARFDVLEDIVIVPTSAIVHKDQLTGIYTINDNQTASLRWVRLGRAYGDHVEILSGLSSREKFVLASEGKLYNGVPVAIKAEQAVITPTTK
jgi:RND family efflux transporter MFP subunit